MSAEQESRFDVAVLGGGPGGYAAALRAAQRGASVCLIEAGLTGGTCLNVGCIPSKAMLHAAELLHDARRSAAFGLTGGEALGVDGAAFMARVARTVQGLRKGVEGLLAARKVQVIRGRGRLTARDALAVEVAGEARTVRAGAIILATGSRPVRPAFLPPDHPRIITTDQATTAAALPESVLIIGGGVIGCEFATIYSELGIPTTLVEMLDALLAEFDADASRAVAAGLKQRGASVLTGARITALRAEDAGVAAELASGATLTAATALVAVGRRPNVEDIGLEAVGVEVAGGVIAVDEACRTSVPGVYAVGDAAERRQLAHLAARMGVVAADNATGHPAGDDRSVVPAGVYTHPEVASVGMSEAGARAACPPVRVAKFPLAASGMAHAAGQTAGAVKIFADPATGRILGASILGHRATDIIQEIALAMRQGLSVGQVAETIHPHPTFAEAVGEAAHSWCGLPLHTLR